MDNIKTLYLTDLDGTLLQNDATLSPYAVRELNRMIQKGLCFSISSARSTGTVIASGLLAGEGFIGVVIALIQAGQILMAG